MLRDLSTACLALSALPAVSVADNTAQVGEIIDLQGYQGLLFVINAGNLGDADATFTVLIEESDASDMSGATPVDDGDLIGTEADVSFTFADDNFVAQIGYVGVMQFVRVTITPAGNASAALLSAVAIVRPELIGKS